MHEKERKKERLKKEFENNKKITKKVSPAGWGICAEG